MQVCLEDSLVRMPIRICFCAVANKNLKIRGSSGFPRNHPATINVNLTFHDITALTICVIRPAININGYGSKHKVKTPTARGISRPPSSAGKRWQVPKLYRKLPVLFYAVEPAPPFSPLYYCSRFRLLLIRDLLYLSRLRVFNVRIEPLDHLVERMLDRFLRGITV